MKDFQIGVATKSIINFFLFLFLDFFFLNEPFYLVQIITQSSKAIIFTNDNNNNTGAILLF